MGTTTQFDNAVPEMPGSILDTAKDLVSRGLSLEAVEEKLLTEYALPSMLVDKTMDILRRDFKE